MNNIIAFPTHSVRAPLKHKLFLTQRYTEACVLFDRYREKHQISDSHTDLSFARHWQEQAEYWGSQLDAIGGAL